jgi:hypothetical protein
MRREGSAESRMVEEMEEEEEGQWWKQCNCDQNKDAKSKDCKETMNNDGK